MGINSKVRAFGMFTLELRIDPNKVQSVILDKTGGDLSLVFYFVQNTR